jgi:predicted Rossmann fold nucleotide-binding protein DprA/Smf involved in DNA uptake
VAWPVKKIVSGGQTGVDRAALDVALELGIPCGGWCPAGRRAEDGAIPARYPLQEAPSRDYGQRTEWNVRDSTATLILARRPLSGGTARTERLARRYGRRCLVVDPQKSWSLAKAQRWLAANPAAVLNVAGPRDDPTDTIYSGARAFLTALLTATRALP